MASHGKPGADSGVVALAKRTVECNGGKVRMEFYPDGVAPRFCPLCGDALAVLGIEDSSHVSACGVTMSSIGEAFAGGVEGADAAGFVFVDGGGGGD